MFKKRACPCSTKAPFIICMLAHVLHPYGVMQQRCVKGTVEHCPYQRQFSKGKPLVACMQPVE